MCHRYAGTIIGHILCLESAVHLYRRSFAALVGLAAVAALSGTAHAQENGNLAMQLGERSIGAADAPVTIVEYFSLTCPHCATFHNETYEDLKAKYVDTGQVRFVYHEFPLDGVALRASMMSRCVDPARYSGIIQVLFKTQNNWARAGDPVAELRKLARLAGLGDDAFESCLNSEELANGILQQRQEASAAGVQSTPTFQIEGRMYPGSRSIEEFSEILDPLLANN